MVLTVAVAGKRLSRWGARLDAAGAFRELFDRRNARALAFLMLMYGIRNLVADTYGFFFPYILQAVVTTSARASYALQAIWFATAVAVGAFCMPLVDHVSRQELLPWSSVLQIVAFSPFVFLHATFVVARSTSSCSASGRGIGQQSLFRLWSGELFPTLLRSSQGFVFGEVRIGLGGWILLLSTIEKAGFSTLAFVLAALLLISGAIGIAFAPNTRGRDLQETATAKFNGRRRRSPRPQPRVVDRASCTPRRPKNQSRWKTSSSLSPPVSGASPAGSSKNGAISACQRALTS